jgi:hypothetical protein
MNAIHHLPSSPPACRTRRVNIPPTPNLHMRHRFPAEIISHWVWQDCRFCPRYRDVEELMADPRSA